MASILVISCVPDHTSRKEDRPQPLTTTELNQEEETDTRDYWQKPDVVISKMGNIQEKVIADIGAGLGYFSFALANEKAKKVIAIDIDPEMIESLNLLKMIKMETESNFDERFETRLSLANDPLLKDDEVDIILIVNTVTYFENRLDYLSNLKSKLKDNGQLVIVDFKYKRIDPSINPPPTEQRVPLHSLEKEIEQAGYSSFISDDTSLDYSYILVAEK